MVGERDGGKGELGRKGGRRTEAGRKLNFVVFLSSYSPRAAKGSSPAPLPSALLKQCTSFEDLCPHVFTMLYYLGPQAHTDPVLLAKVLRLGRAFLKERSGNSSSEELPPQERVSSILYK